MKRLFLLLLLLGMLAAPGAAADHPLLSLVPQRPLLVLSGTDFSGTIGRLKSLDAYRRHSESKDREQFDDSKLALKLSARVEQFGEFVGHKIDFDTLLELSGNHTALALYDIGQLTFLLLSDLDLKGQAALSYLEKFESLDTRKVGQRTFYVKEDPDKGLSFALYRADDLLLVSNQVTLIEDALNLLEAGAPGQSYAKSEAWTAATEADPGLVQAPTVLCLDSERLVHDRYFKYYWAFGNRQQFLDVRALVSSIEIKNGSLHERRVVLGAKEKPGNTLTAKGLPAVWSEAGAGPDPAGELAAFFGWTLPASNPWTEAIQGRLLAVQAHPDGDNPVRFAKGAVLLFNGAPPIESLTRSILDGVRSQLLLAPASVSFTPEAKDVFAFEPLAGFPGAYVAAKGSMLVIANDRAMLSALQKKAEPAGDARIEEWVSLDASDQLPIWAKAFRQMGPEAAFDNHNTGVFFAIELSGLLDAAAAFRSFRLKAERLENGALIQQVVYEK